MKFEFRRHQQEALDLANDAEAGKTFKRILLNVTPGGGKSAQPVIVGHRLIERKIVDKICWVIPRDSLRAQSEDAFLDRRLRDKLGHTRAIRAVSNQIDPARGVDGYATTYQAIAANPELHASEFARHKYLLVLDEFHHLGDDGAWLPAIERLVRRSAFVLFMTGTPSRSASGTRIGFMNYVKDGNGLERIDLAGTPEMPVINYSRADALKDGAVIPISMELIDSDARWLNPDGSESFVPSLTNLDIKHASRALTTVLRKDTAFRILEQALNHWRIERRAKPNSKFLVVAPNIVQAQTYLRHIRSFDYGRFDIATSDDSQRAKTNIDRFKALASQRPDHLDGLVTVGMAYEGLDCRPVDHIACLTNIRSPEWIEQMVSRGTRFSPENGDVHAEQRCHLFTPNDDLIRSVMGQIIEEQKPFVREREEDKQTKVAGDGPAKTSGNDNDIRPLDANKTGVHAIDFGVKESVDAEEYLQLDIFMERAGVAGKGLSKPMVKQLLLAANVQIDSLNGVTVAPATQVVAPISDARRPSEIESDLRKELVDLVKKHAIQTSMPFLRGPRIKEINADLKRLFGSRDSTRTGDEIQRMIDHMKRITKRAA